MFIERVLAATSAEVSKKAAEEAAKTTEGIFGGLDQAFSFAGGISNLLTFGLMIGGAIAFGTIVYGGIIYSMSGDDSSKQKEAKAWIWAAVKGIAVMAFGYFLLRLLNPGSFGQ